MNPINTFNTPIMPIFNSLIGQSFNQQLLPQFNSNLISSIGPPMVHEFNSFISSTGKAGMNQLISSSGHYQFSI